MGIRLLIQLDEAKMGAGLPAEVEKVLESARATHVGASHRELRGLYTAVLPDDSNVPEVIEQIKRSPSIKYVEIDQLRSTF